MVSRDGQGTDVGALEGDTQTPGQVASTQPQPQRQKDLGAFNFKLLYAEHPGSCSSTVLRLGPC